MKKTSKKAKKLAKKSTPVVATPAASAPEEQIKPDTQLTSSRAAALLQVTASSVVKWAKDGILKAYTTPGGHRRIKAADLRAFAEKYGMPVPSALPA